LYLIACVCRTYGIVYKAQNKATGTYVAIKKFKDSDDDEYVSGSTSLFAGQLLILRLTLSGVVWTR